MDGAKILPPFQKKNMVPWYKPRHYRLIVDAAYGQGAAIAVTRNDHGQRREKQYRPIGRCLANQNL
jgi:hypothetical protein